METTERCSRNCQNRRSNTAQGMPEIDRISGLPDAILCHILSFLPTQMSVATSILSRRWRLLWTYVPNLDFTLECRNLKTVTSFSEIINRVLLLNKVQGVNTIRLPYCKDECSEYQLRTWIADAISRNVQNLYLSFSSIVMLPRCLFTCKTLVDLRLNRCGGIPTTGVVCLPALKKLHLTCFQYETDESLPSLLSGCPVLEELMIIGRIMHQDLVCFNISSPTIKRLQISQPLNYIHYDYAPALEINAPGVQYLQITTHSSKHIKAGVLTSLIEADICLWNYRHKEDDFLYSRSVLEFIERLCNVKYLILQFHRCTEILDTAFSASTVKFDNLTKLELRTDCHLLSRFLENADNLETLIYQEIVSYYEEPKAWTEPQQVPTCLLSHLRTVTMVQLMECNLEIVGYLMSNGQVLERMEIKAIHLDGKKGKYSVREEISLFQRGSEACELVFGSHCY